LSDKTAVEFHISLTNLLQKYNIFLIYANLFERKCTIYTYYREKVNSIERNWSKSELGVFGAEDGTDEIVGTGVDGAVFGVFREWQSRTYLALTTHLPRTYDALITH